MKTLYTNDLGTLKVIFKNNKYIIKEYSIFNMMGEVIGEYDSFEEAMANI